MCCAAYMPEGNKHEGVFTRISMPHSSLQMKTWLRRGGGCDAKVAVCALAASPIGRSFGNLPCGFRGLWFNSGFRVWGFREP